jgi:hypothetical protein
MDKTISEAHSEAVLPFSGKWFRFSNVTKRLSGDIKLLGMEEAKPLWMVDYSGGRRAKHHYYEPGPELLQDALDLQLPDDMFEEPSVEILEFLKKWGPMGEVFMERDMKDIIYLTYAVNQSQICFGQNVLNTTGSDFRDKLIAGILPPRESFYDGYSEHSYLIIHDLKSLKEISVTCKQDLGSLNRVLPQKLPRKLEENKEGKIVRKFDFCSLHDVLYLLLENELVSGGRWRTCQYKKCKDATFFLPAGVHDRKYCCPKHRKAENERSSDERRRQPGLEKEKRKMRSRVYVRETKDRILSTPDADKIRKKINKAVSISVLENLEKTYPVLKLKTGGKKNA